ncbi:zf-CHY-domain-containing protein [Aulographum hederae CBS 113979]|uniref:Zf-CHY-domain-containing protein n=1 Tax=Aulographum hederae CBS 113979 TaxID=1176131 RepID=A0A6G1H0R3_9PEZI|nr:zf-CHY-domain-containing protein [Aulographum hederae CBS 113979]
MSSSLHRGTPHRLRSDDTIPSTSSTRIDRPANGRRSRRSDGRAGLGLSIQGEISSTVLSTSLPEDDGMRLLRQRIQEIHGLKTTKEDKARRMQLLMTEDYRTLAPQVGRDGNSSSAAPLDRPFTPSSPNSMLSSDISYFSPESASSPTPDSQNPFNVLPADELPTYRPRVAHQLSSESVNKLDAAEHDSEEVDEPVLGCEHYVRNVKIQCFDCRKWYTCRHCHDAAEYHTLNRKKTENMLCMLCSTPQPAGEYCKQCGELAAWYYCGVCKLWDGDSTNRIYHCDDCGICRRGEGIGKDFVHCKRCNVCISIRYASKTNHTCIERATECDCPICNDYMFTSSASVAAMPCGHYMHKSCYMDYMLTAYKCPICKKSAVNMETQWNKLDAAIESQPMPTHFRDTRVIMHCNDCDAKSEGKYHWLGSKCAMCDSYNTTELRILGREQEGASVRDRNEESTSTSILTRPAGISPPSRSRTMPIPQGGGSYFLAVPENNGSESARPASPTATGISMGNVGIGSFSPYEMLQRFGRSLSPIRHYLATSEGETDGGEDDDDSELDFWGADGRFLSGDETDDEEDESSDDVSGSDENPSDEDGEEGEEGDEGRGRGRGAELEIDLIGHR